MEFRHLLGYDTIDPKTVQGKTSTGSLTNQFNAGNTFEVRMKHYLGMSGIKTLHVQVEIFVHVVRNF